MLGFIKWPIRMRNASWSNSYNNDPWQWSPRDFHPISHPSAINWQSWVDWNSRWVRTPVDLDTYFKLAHATRGMKSKRAKTMSISSKQLETSIHYTRRATYNKGIDFRYTRHISAGSRGRFRALVGGGNWMHICIHQRILSRKPFAG